MRTLLRHLPTHMLAVLAFYLGIATVITYPLITVLSTHLAGHPFGDSYEIARHAWWIKYALQTGQPLFEQPLLLYPQGLPSWYFWGNPLQLFPTWLLAFVLPLPTAYNLQLLLTLALNGWAMYMLAHTLTGNRPAALIAGTIFCAYPTMQGHAAAGHMGLITLWSVPLFIRALVEKRWRASAVFFALGPLGSTQTLFYLMLPAALLLLIIALREGRRDDALRTAGAALAGGLLAALFIVPALLETWNAPAQVRDESGIVRYSADLLAIATPSPFHPLFRTFPHTGGVLGIEPFEGAGYLGIFAALLGLLAAVRVPASRKWLALGTVVWLLSLGPLLRFNGEVVSLRTDGYLSGITLPYAALMNLPGIEILRTPGRFNFAVGLAVAVVAAYGSRHLWSWIRVKNAKWPLAFAISLLILFDYHFWWRESALAFPTIPAEAPQAISALSARDDIRAVFHIPWQHPLVGKDALWLQTAYQQPMIAGHVTRRTPLDPARGWLLQTLDPVLLRSVGADVVILHRAWGTPELEQQAHKQLGTPFYEDSALMAWEPAAGGPPQAQVTDAQAVGREVWSYLFLPAPAVIRVEGTAGEAAQALVLEIDGLQVENWSGEPGSEFSFQHVLEAGWHALMVTDRMACSVVLDSSLSCATLPARELQVTILP